MPQPVMRTAMRTEELNLALRNNAGVQVDDAFVMYRNRESSIFTVTPPQETQILTAAGRQEMAAFAIWLKLQRVSGAIARPNGIFYVWMAHGPHNTITRLDHYGWAGRGDLGRFGSPTASAFASDITSSSEWFVMRTGGDGTNRYSQWHKPSPAPVFADITTFPDGETFFVNLPAMVAPRPYIIPWNEDHQFLYGTSRQSLITRISVLYDPGVN